MRCGFLTAFGDAVHVGNRMILCPGKLWRRGDGTQAGESGSVWSTQRGEPNAQQAAAAWVYLTGLGMDHLRGRNRRGASRRKSSAGSSQGGSSRRRSIDHARTVSHRPVSSLRRPTASRASMASKGIGLIRERPQFGIFLYGLLGVLLLVLSGGG